MAISFVAAGAVSTGTNPTVAVPAGYAVNDLLLLITSGTAAPTIPSGWTQVSAEGANRFITVLYKFASSSESSVSLTLAGTTSVAVMLAYRGAGAYEIVPAYTTGTSTTATPNTLTTTVANDYVINVYANLAGAARTLTANASTTSRANSSTTTTVNGLLIADELRASTGVTIARAATISASSAWSAIAIGFMPARNVYWRGGGGTWDTTSTTNWSLTSGGAGGTPVPTIIDDVLFDANSAIADNGGLLGVTLTGALNCNSITVSNASCNFLDGTTPTLNCNSSITLTNTCIWQSTGTITFTGTGTLTTNGVIFSAPIVINGSGITTTLGSSLWSSGSITVTQGTFDTANKAVTCSTFSSSNTNTRAITLGTSTVTLTSTANPATIWDLGTTTNLTFSGASSAIRISGRSTATQTFAGGGLTYGKLVLALPMLISNSYTFIISGANTFASISSIRGATITFPAGVTTTFGLFLAQSGGIVINSSSPGTAATLTYTGPGKCSLGTNVTSVRDINFSAANTFYVGAGANNISGNTNVNFSTYILYWVGGNGTWDASSTARWATSSGGAGGADVPSANTPVIVNGSSGSPTITLSGSPTCASLDTTGATCTFTSTGTLSVYGSLTLTSTTTWSGSGALTFKDNGYINLGASTSRLSGCLLQCPLVIDAQGGSVLLAAFSNAIHTIQNTMTLTSGFLGRDPTTGFGAFFEATTFVSNNSNYRELNSCVVTLTSNNTTMVTMTNSDGFTAGGNAAVRLFYTGSTGTRTLDVGSSQQVRNLNIQVTGGSDTVTFTAGNIIGAFSTAAQSSPYNSAFTGTYTNTDSIYAGTGSFVSAITITAGVTISGFGTFNIYSFTGAGPIGAPRCNITPSLTTDLNFHLGFSAGFNVEGILFDTALTTTGNVRVRSAGTTPSRVVMNSSLKMTTNSLLVTTGSVSGNIDITANNSTVLDLRATAGQCPINASLIYSGSTGTRTFSSLINNGLVNVYVNNGTDTVTAVTGSSFNILDFTGFSGTFTGSGTITIGDQGGGALLRFSTGMTQSNTAVFNFGNQAASPQITSNGKSFLNNVNLGLNYNQTVTLVDAFVTTGAIALSQFCNLTVNSNVTATSFSSGNNGTTTINMGNGTWTLTGTGTVWAMGNGVATVNPGTSTIVLSDTSATARTFAGNGRTYGSLVIGGATGSSTTTITGANTFAQISSTKTVAHTLSFAANQTVTTWALSGTAGNLATINSNTANTARTITVTNRTSGVDYLIVRDITSNKTPVTFFAGANSQLQSNVAGVAARTPLPTTEFLYVLDTGTSWTVPANFNSSNNSIHLISGGGGGAGGRASGGTRAGGGGGGGGGYTQATNVALTPGASISYAVGAAGALGAGGANGGAGGATTFNSGAYTTTGGGGGQATTTSSTGGTAGTGSTFNGGVGGIGSFNASSHGHGGGGGAGAAGQNGAGQNGGNGFASATAANVAGGGGGGNGGGTAGGNASSATGGTGGNNFGGSGGASSTAVTAFNGGGGAGGVNATVPGLGSCGVDIYGVGGAGGRGGSPQGAAGTIGLHNYGGGGAGGGVSTAGTTQSGGEGGQGTIIVWYSTISAAAPSTMFMLFR